MERGNAGFITRGELLDIIEKSKSGGNVTTQATTTTRASIHAADLKKSARLQRVLAFLRDRGQAGATTMDIIRSCSVVAVNSVVSELRVNGYNITATRERDDGDTRVYRYRMVA